MEIPDEERRSAGRLDGPFVASIRSRDAAGVRKVHAVLAEDIGTNAMRLRVSGCHVFPGPRVFVLVDLSVSGRGHGPRVAIRGRVHRIEWRADGSCTASVEVTGHRWLFASPHVPGAFGEFEQLF